MVIDNRVIVLNCQLYHNLGKKTKQNIIALAIKLRGAYKSTRFSCLATNPTGPLKCDKLTISQVTSKFSSPPSKLFLWALNWM